MANWRVVTCSEMESEAQRHESTMTSTEQKVGVLLAIQSIIEAYIVVANYDSLLLVNNQIIINNAIRIFSFFQIVTYCVKCDNIIRHLHGIICREIKAKINLDLTLSGGNGPLSVLSFVLKFYIDGYQGITKGLLFNATMGFKEQTHIE